ncbi:MAG: hypothetical protein L3K15_03740 [Thermoplasmata archaeon]|nr:hypothetical protein [Thermoplasmata archaeon]
MNIIQFDDAHSRTTGVQCVLALSWINQTNSFGGYSDRSCWRNSSQFTEFLVW